MSRTSQNSSTDSVKNPATCYLEWAGADGHFTYWNGEERVIVKDLEFALIDSTKSVNGWDSKSNSRIYSNPVKSTNDIFVVREGKTQTVLAEGDYSEIKSERWSLTENVLALAEIDGIVGVVQISLKKSALNALIEFRNNNKMPDLYSNMIKVTPSELQKTGRVEYYTPEFSLSPMDAEMSDQADEADVNLVKPYIEYVKERNAAAALQKEEEAAKASAEA